jgi:hypothetical protein
VPDEIVVHRDELDQMSRVANNLARSGYFKDAREAAQAWVKVLAGRELGLGPTEAMRAIHIVDGKVELSADLLAQRVKTHPDYDFRIVEHTDEVCSIQFYGPKLDGTEGLEPLGPPSTFTIGDARRAGLANKNPWKNYPRNMLFARAMSNGVAWFCPDVAGGARLYVEGEVSGGVADDGGPAAPSERTIVEVEGIRADAETGEILDVAPVSGDDTQDVRSADEPGAPAQAHSGSAPAPDTDPVPTDDIEGRDEESHEHEPERKPDDSSVGDEAEAGGEEESTGGRPGKATTTDAEPPATVAQKKKLGTLASKLGYDDEERHRQAGVDSFNDLSKSDAAALIEVWQARHDAELEHEPEWGPSPRLKTMEICTVQLEGKACWLHQPRKKGRSE